MIDPGVPPAEPEVTDSTATGSRLLRPEMLVALSAVLLSLCGLAVSIYQASLIRTQQHASVWPHLVFVQSYAIDAFSFSAYNLGIGPARIVDIEISHDGEPVQDWDQLFERVLGGATPLPYSHSQLNQMVIAAGGQHQALSLDTERVADPGQRERIRALIQALVEHLPRIDIAACYCSVYDECWRTSRSTRLQPEAVRAADCRFNPDRRFQL